MKLNTGLPVDSTFVKSDLEDREKHNRVSDDGVKAESFQKKIPDLGVDNWTHSDAAGSKELLEKAAVSK